MLTVHTPARSHFYFQMSTAGGSPSAGVHPYVTYQVRPIYGPFDVNRNLSKREMVQQVEGRIIDLPGELLGDKPVLHYNIDGDINLVPFATTKVTYYVGDNQLIPVKRVSCGPGSYSGTLDYTHILSSETDFVEVYSYNGITSPPVKNQGRGTLYVRLYYYNDGRYGWGTYNDREYWDGTKFVHTNNGTITGGSFESANLIYKTAINFTTTDLSKFLAHTPTRGVTTGLSTATKKYWPKDAYTWLPTNGRLAGLGRVLREDIFPPLRMKPDPYILGDLSQRCINQQEYVDVNTLGFVNELRNISLLIPKIGNWKSPKTWGSLYLWWKYGVTLTLSDTKNLLEAISVTRAVQEFPKPVTSVFASNSRTETIKGATYIEESHYKLSYSKWPSPIMEFIRKGRNWNLWPKLETAWDMVPFSFVVDWVIDIQSLLSRLDTYTDVQYFDVAACCWSRKVIVTLPAASVYQWDAMEGNITFTYYHRSIGPRPHLPKLRLDETGQFKNYAELASLIVTR